MNFVYSRDVLPSGLRVVTVETPHLHTAMISAYVRTGSRHEAPSDNGVSHFLEHMFFRGTEAFPDTAQMNAAVEEVGGNLNGITTRDHGYYYTPLHPDHLEVGIRILGDMLTRPLLTQMEVERQIILEEMLDEVDDRGRDIDIDNLSKMELFKGHPLALKIAGTPTSVKALTLDRLRSHFLKNYVSQNVVFAAAGRVDRNRVLELVQEGFQAMPKGEMSWEAPPPLNHHGPSLKFVRHDEAQTAFRLTFWTVPEQHEDFPALQLIRRILDDGLSSRLPFNVVEKRGLAYSLHAGMEAFHDVGLFDIEAACAPEKTAVVFEEICRTLGGLRERPVLAEELARAKRRHRMQLEFIQDSPGDLAGWFGGTELFRVPESFDEHRRRIEGQSAESIREVAQRYFSRQNLSVVAVGPKRGVRALERAIDRAEGLST